MMMPGRTYSAQTGYRYGFNGKENDNEIKGEGNQQDYGMRIYDPRLGRFLSVDPLTKDYPWYTPYQFAGNKPVWCIDLDGLEDALPKQQPKTPVLTTSSESTCIGCAERSKAMGISQFQLNTEKLREGYEIWRQQPGNLSKPVPPEYQKVAGLNVKPQATFNQGGYLGSKEYKLAQANYETYGKYLPGVSDFDDLVSFANAVGEGKVDEATIFAVGFIIPEVSGKMLKGPIHHIFTNKNFIRGQQWSKKFAPLFEKAGYKLNDAINKIEVIGHKGPHPEEYHQAIFDRLQSATKGLEGAEYKKAFESTLQTLKNEVSTAGTALNKLVTKQ
jgi:RHS repeat-associated protein